MPIILSLSFLICVALFCVVGFAQDKKDTREVNGVIIHHDKFRDQDTVLTKPIDVSFHYAKQGYFCNLIIGFVKKEGEKPTLALLITPGGTGKATKFAESMARNARRTTIPYLSSDADVILLVDGKKFALEHVTKDIGILPSGDIKSSVVAELSSEILDAIVNAKKIEIAVGSLEGVLVERYMDHIREKLKAVQSQYADAVK